MAELASRGLGWALVPRQIARYPPFREDLTRLADESLSTPPVIEVETVRRRNNVSSPIAQWLQRTLGERFRNHRLR
ncbi:hypothetical protein OM427_23920 [Halomonas sp. 18H]|uniref:hypothetical protein n=1 Tax=Halomonas almeriensis TaxID=308163 RepID=UPI002230CFBB|nr:MULTISPECIES: hypothetical protein [Halomonas]MCW4152568.1 hypothetical protein [Halomonas sp. 18H]MDN3553856.1 hypothetical protein [Halomonas almeriensis]